MVVCFGAVVWSGKAWAFEQGLPGQTITESVTLTQDVTAPAAVNGIMIDGDDVVLDGGGHLISGPLGSAASGDPPWGIYVAPNRRNVVIRNVRVWGFNNAIWLDTGAQDCIVENCQMTASTWHGVALAGGSGNIVRNCTAQYNHRGIELRGQAHHDTLLEANILEDNRDGGIALFADATPVSTAIMIRNNTLRGNGSSPSQEAGIDIEGTVGHSGSVITGNTVTGSFRGVLIAGSQDALLAGNTIRDSGFSGVQVGSTGEAPAVNTMLLGNVICSPSGVDIFVWPESSVASGTTGGGNTCDYTQNYSDAGAIGCTSCCAPVAGDVTAPSTPVVSDDGIFTGANYYLQASWDATDPESGIAEFQYAIGTSPGAQDVVPWTTAFTSKSMFAAGLSLADGTTYYCAVRARNGACLWSDVGVSDGITVDTAAPVAQILSPAAGSTVKGIVTVSAIVSDAVSGVATVQIGALGRWTEFTSPPYQLVVDTREATVPEGLQSMRVDATDHAGNFRLGNSVGITVDNTTFDDMWKPWPFWRYVEALVDATVTSGCSASPPLYCPLKSVTRGEMAKFLCSAAGKTRLDATTPTFADVPRGSGFYGWIERLADSASWGGNPPTSGCKKVGTTRYFCPNENVTRAQMAKFLCVARGKTWAAKPTPTFSDVPASHQFYGWIERLADAASWGGTAPTSGCTATKYCPDASVRRDEMAKFLVLAFGMPYYQGL
jgi:parallel beta-helix repeat protein